MAGVGLMTAITTLWMMWSMGEMYYEGWWGGWRVGLVYLIPGMVCWCWRCGGPALAGGRWCWLG